MSGKQNEIGKLEVWTCIRNLNFRQTMLKAFYVCGVQFSEPSGTSKASRTYQTDLVKMSFGLFNIKQLILINYTI